MDMEREYIGWGSAAKLEGIIARYKPKTVFLVTGNESYGISGAREAVERHLGNSKVMHFHGFRTNPRIEDVERGIGLYRQENPDLVVAVGGGSVLDIAKSINILSANDRDAADYVQKRASIKSKGRLMVAMPTTAGSGSEATQFAVAYIGKDKYSLDHKLMLPDYAIVDPVFTMSLPKDIAASTGLDALSQSIESYWSVNSTEESKDYAGEAINLIIRNLAKAVNSSSIDSKEAMSKAAHLAGKAINISRTTACHAISYPITSYFGVPHGHAVAITLAPMMIYNSEVIESDCSDSRGHAYVKDLTNKIAELMDADGAEEASKKITKLMLDIGLHVKLCELGIETDEDIEIIIKKGFNPDRVKNNPRKLDENQLRNILNSIR